MCPHIPRPFCNDLPQMSPEMGLHENVPQGQRDPGLPWPPSVRQWLRVFLRGTLFLEKHAPTVMQRNDVSEACGHL